MKCVLWPGRDTAGVHDRFGELAGFPILALSPFSRMCFHGLLLYVRSYGPGAARRGAYARGRGFDSAECHLLERDPFTNMAGEMRAVARARHSGGARPTRGAGCA